MLCGKWEIHNEKLRIRKKKQQTSGNDLKRAKHKNCTEVALNCSDLNEIKNVQMQLFNVLMFIMKLANDGVSFFRKKNL